MYEERLKIYEEIISRCPRFERKGKTMPYTSANGYMFSQLNKAAEIGLRLSKEAGEKFKEEHQTTIFKSYGAVMRDYVLIPDNMLGDIDLLAKYFNKGFDHVMSLKPK